MVRPASSEAMVAKELQKLCHQYRTAFTDYLFWVHELSDASQRGELPPDSALAGERRAFDLLVAKYQRRLMRLVSRLVHDPAEMNNLYGQPGQEDLTRTLKAELARLKAAVKDDDQFANEQPPNGVDPQPPRPKRAQ